MPISQATFDVGCQWAKELDGLLDRCLMRISIDPVQGNSFLATEMPEKEDEREVSHIGFHFRVIPQQMQKPLHLGAEGILDIGRHCRTESRLRAQGGKLMAVDTDDPERRRDTHTGGREFAAWPPSGSAPSRG